MNLPPADVPAPADRAPGKPPHPETCACPRRWSLWVILLAAGLAVGCLVAYLLAQPPRVQQVQSRPAAAFDLRSAIIPRSEIRAGGPPKDGIPALTDPAVIDASGATCADTERVVGVVLGESARAYPLRILNYHEIVNDQLGGIPIAVTYCPLCDSVAVFDRRIAGKVLQFGVSGLLYNSNVLMYDRGGRPESLWSQVAAQGVSGPFARQTLQALPVALTTWKDWRLRHPGTTVLSERTGYARDYQVNPYQAYFAERNLMFPARPVSQRLPAKTPVLGVWAGSKARAYPLSAFDPRGQTLDQELDGKRFKLVYDGQHQAVRVAAADDGLQWMYAFWFAWYAFRPGTELYEGSR